MKNRILSFFLILVGALAIVLAIRCYTFQPPLYPDGYRAFEENVYTELYHVTTRAANNLVTVDNHVKFGVSSILLVAGITMAGFGAVNFVASFFSPSKKKGDEEA